MSFPECKIYSDAIVICEVRILDCNVFCICYHNGHYTKCETKLTDEYNLEIAATFLLNQIFDGRITSFIYNNHWPIELRKY